MSMETLITALVVIVATVTTLLMIYLIVKVYRGDAREEDRDTKHQPPPD